MPITCIDQMPIPMAMAPPTSHAAAMPPRLAVICAASCSAVKEATTATTSDSITMPRL